MSRSTARALIARVSTAVAAAALLAVTVAAPPSAAATAPTPGTRCAMSGLTSTVSGTVFVCRATTGVPRWSTGMTTSRSPLTMADAWMKAAESGMTSGFGVVTNPTSTTVRIVGASSPLSAAVQLHEVVMSEGAMVMQERPRGFLIPAGGTLDLEPGGNHLMLMKIKRPITPGMLIPVTLITSTGGLIKASLLAKTFAGAVEDYDPGMS
jgi:copper(I)-binding protein